MERPEIEEKIISILRDQRTFPEEQLAPDKPLSELGFDSLDALNVLFAIEETFSISIPDDQARAIRTLRDMTEAVASRLSPSVS